MKPALSLRAVAITRFANSDYMLARTPNAMTLPHDGDCGLWWRQTSSFAGGFAIQANLGT